MAQFLKGNEHKVSMLFFVTKSLVTFLCVWNYRPQLWLLPEEVWGSSNKANECWNKGCFAKSPLKFWW